MAPNICITHSDSNNIVRDIMTVERDSTSLVLTDDRVAREAIMGMPVRDLDMLVTACANTIAIARSIVTR